jgi:hypothetical protein
MKMQFLVSAALISQITSVNLPTLAQTPVENLADKNQLVANAQNIEKTNNIKKLLEITGAKTLTQQLLIQMLNSMKSEYPQVPEKFWDTFMAEINPDEMVKEFIPLYDKYFTNEEIKQMIAFYETPLGKKTLTVLPQITQESTAIGIRYGRAAAERALRKLESEGYIRGR